MQRSLGSKPDLACVKARRIEGALGIILEALADIERTGIRYYEAELNRLEGELRLGLDEGRSEVCFQRAIAIARAQQAKSFELRATLSLARLWRDQGKRTETRTRLRLVHRRVRYASPARRQGAAR
jgi:predicted ATPase